MSQCNVATTAPPERPGILSYQSYTYFIIYHVILASEILFDAFTLNCAPPIDAGIHSDFVLI